MQPSPSGRRIDADGCCNRWHSRDSKHSCHSCPARLRQVHSGSTATSGARSIDVPQRIRPESIGNMALNTIPVRCYLKKRVFYSQKKRNPQKLRLRADHSVLPEQGTRRAKIAGLRFWFRGPDFPARAIPATLATTFRMVTLSGDFLRPRGTRTFSPESHQVRNERRSSKSQRTDASGLSGD